MNFNQKVWELTKKVPKGRVTTYSEVAHALNTSAYRAVGNALNRNPYKTVPCHRIIKSDGTIGGFAQRVQAKIKILEKEGIKFEKNKIKDFKKKLYTF